MSVYVPPASSDGSSSCSGGCATRAELQYNYLKGYFTAHAFSVSSYRYEFITWFALVAIFAILALFYHSGIADQTWLGALWSRWAVRNRVIKYGRSATNRSGNDTYSRKKKDRLIQELKKPSRKVFTFPSFGRTLLLFALILVPVALTLVGADYIRPSAAVFDMSESWPNSSISINTPGLSRRDLSLVWGQGQYPSVTISAPTITLPYRTFWTAGSRIGGMTNALTPLIVIIALKQIPFALLSTRLMGGYSFDRLSFMHKWGGRVVWLFATTHVILWVVQISREPSFYTPMWTFIFMWTKFRWGFVSYGFFTLLILLSIGPMRTHYYEVFYICHVICIIGFMVTAWLHHPPAGYWMYVTLLWWAAERITRAAKVAWINGIGFTGRCPQVIMSPTKRQSIHTITVSDTSSHTLQASYPPFPYKQQLKEDYSMDRGPIDEHQVRHSQRYDAVSDVIDGYVGAEPGMMMQSMNRVHPERYALTDHSSTGHRAEQGGEKEGKSQSSHPESAHQSQNPSVSTLVGSSWTSKRGPRPALAADIAAVIKPGYAYAQLLPGKTIRLTLRTPNSFAWRPGQYVHLSIPCVRWWQSHPFTIASAYNAGLPSSAAWQGTDVEQGMVVQAKGEGRTIVLLIRARRGFTYDLWNYVRLQREQQIRTIEEQTGQQYIRGEVAKTATGVHLRAIIDGPYGTIQRVRWGAHSTVVIIAGGSGITSAMSVLEYLCSVMAQDKKVKGFQACRVRFVWMLREYAHLQWIASALRRCIEMVPPEQLQVDLFVTKIKRYRLPHSLSTTPNASSYALNTNGATGMSYSQSQSSMGLNSHDDSYNFTGFTEGTDQEDYEVNALDLTEYEGENNDPSATEAKISERVFKEGKMRRANTRRATLRRTNGRGAKATAGSSGSTSGAERGTLPRSLSALAHQTSVHESSRHPNPTLHRIASTIPERDLGVEESEQEQDASRYEEYVPYRSTNGLLQPHTNGSGPIGQSLTNASELSLGGLHRGETVTSAWQSPGRSPLQTPILDGTTTPGDYYGASSTYLPFNDIDNSSKAHLNEIKPNQYEGGEAITPVISEVDAPVDLDEEENADLQVLAELARQGYPKLDTILREEVQRSSGRVLVSACGPESLGKLVRSIASKQINLSEIRKGHLNGHINVISDSFST